MMMKYLNRFRGILLGGFLGAVMAASAQDVYLWTAGSFQDGNPANDNHRWDNPANWDRGAVPPSNAVVVINSGTPNATALGTFNLTALQLQGGTLITHGMVVQTLQLAGGILDGTNTLAAGGSGYWTNGWIAGRFTNAVGAVLNLVTANAHNLADFAWIENQGTIQWETNAALLGYTYGGPVTLVTRGNGTLRLAGDVTPFQRYYAYTSFNVTNDPGTLLHKSTGTGAVTIANTVMAQHGEVRVSSGVIEFHQSADLGAAARFTGAGSVRLEAGTLTASGTLEVDGAVFIIAGGTFAGDPACTVRTPNGSRVEWTGGVLAGQLTLATDSSMVLFGSQSKYLADGSTIRNQGTVEWQGPGSLVGYTYGAPNAWINESNAVFRVAADGVPFGRIYGYQPFTVTNLAGSLMHKSAGTNIATLQNFTLHQQGELRVSTGEVEFHAPVYWRGAPRLTGGGTARLMTSDQGLDGALIMDGASFEQAGGQFTATPAGRLVTTNGAGWRWLGGVVGGQVTLSAGSSLVLSGNQSKTLADGTVFRNQGTVEWQGPGTVVGYTYSGPVIWINESNAVFRLAAAGQPMSVQYGYHPFRVTNLAGGLIHKSIATGTNLLVSIALVNQGEIRATGGLIEFQTPTELTSGTRLKGPGSVRLSGSSLTLSGPVSVDAATFEFSAGTLIAATNSSLETPFGGRFVWSGGSVLGTLVLATNAVTTIGPASGTRYLEDGAMVKNFGILNWTEGSIIGRTYGGSAAIHNASSGRMRLRGATTLGRQYGYTQASFTNDGVVFLDGQLNTDWLLYQNASGAIELTLAGTNSLTDHGRIAASQTAAWNGSVRAITTNGFAPQLDQRFTFLTAGAISGILNPGTLPLLGPERAWEIEQTATYAALHVTGDYPCTPRPAGLIYWLRAEDNARDSIGGQVAGLRGGLGYGPGKVGRAFQLDGVDDAVEIGPWFNRQVFSMTFWVKPGAYQVGYADILDNNHTGYRSFVVQYQSNGGQPVGFGINPGGTIPITFTDGLWQHLAITRDTGFVTRVYLNGVLQGSLTNAAEIVYDGSQYLRLGMWGGGGRHFNGAIDEFAIYDRALAAADVQSLHQSGVSGACTDGLTTPACVPAPAGLALWISGDGGTNDITRGAPVLTNNGATYAPGFAGRALTLDGVNDYVTLPDSPAMRFTNLTIEGWVRDTTGGYRVIASKTLGGSAADSFALWLEGGQLKAAISDSPVFAGTQTVLSVPYSAAAGQWCHVALTFDDTANELKLYTNGALAGTLAENRSIGYDAHPLVIGAEYESEALAFYFAGQLDELTFYQSALTPAAIAAIHAASTGGKCREPGLLPACVTPPAGLIAWWTGNGTTNALVGQGATLEGGATFAPGIVNQAFSFDGVDDLASVGDFPELSGATELTLMAWVYKAPGTATRMAVMGKWDSSEQTGRNSFLLFNGEDANLNRGTFALAFADGTRADVSGSSLPIPAGEWMHLAATWRSSDGALRLYKNGALDATATGGAGKTLHHHTWFPARIGEWGMNNRPDSRWRGQIDEPMVFTRALTDAEIAGVVAAGAAGVCRAYLPDLALHSVAAPAAGVAGLPVPVIFVTTNRGLSASAGAWAFDILVAGSTNGAGAVFLGRGSHTGLVAPGQSLVLTQNVILPAWMQGTYYFGVAVDTGGAIDESSEANNTRFTATPLTMSAADLKWGNPQAPASANFGQSLVVSCQATNQGNAPVTAPWTGQLLLSTRSNDFTGAILLESPAGMPLAAGSNHPVSVEIKLPLQNGLQPGTYYLVWLADSGNTIAESNEDNNLGIAAMVLGYPSLPDLAITQVLAPAFLPPGSELGVSYALTNMGNLSATGRWSEVILISNAQHGVVGLGEWPVNTPLAAGATLVRTQQVMVPPSLPAGDWSLLVRADARGELVEPDKENNNRWAPAPATVRAVLGLYLSVSQTSEDGALFYGTVTRNGEFATPLVVSISNSHPAELAMTNEVLIPAGADAASFTITPLRDFAVDGPRTVIIGALHTNFQSAYRSLLVLDVDVPALRLDVGAASLTEGTTITGTVSRTHATNLPLTVVFNVSEPSRLEVPSAVTIPANQLSQSFTVTAAENNLVESTRVVALEAQAGGYSPAATNLSVLDNDMPTVVLELASATISEGAGPNTTTATLTRTPASARSLTVELWAGTGNALLIPGTAAFGAGASRVTVPVGAVDNQLLDGPRTNHIQVFVLDPSGQRLASGAGATLVILDDDGPTLKVELDHNVAAEGVTNAATARITRNTTNGTLAVSFSSSDSSELATPPGIMMPAGVAEVTIVLTSLLDGISDGNQRVVFTASAAGYTDGKAVMVITDIDLPDLVVSAVAAPTNGLTGGSLLVSYRLENQGLTTAPAGFHTRLLLSTDPYPGGDDLLVTEMPTTEPLPVGQAIEQAVQMLLPERSGNYYFLVVADARGAVNEVLEDNNVRASARPVGVAPAYTATVQTATETALAGTPIAMTVSTTRTGAGQPAAGVPVNIHITVRDTRRTFRVTTDATGGIPFIFVPLPGEAGHYQIGAAHPGEETAPIQDQFSLVGIQIKPEYSELSLYQSTTVTARLEVVNLGQDALSGLSASVVSAPANLGVVAQLTDANLAADGRQTLLVAVTAQNAATPLGEVCVRVTGGSGATADAWLRVRVTTPQARLTAVPGSLYETMVLGKQKVVEFALANDGGAATGPLSIALPPASWLTAATAIPLPPLAAGETQKVALLLNPSSELPLGPYRSSVVISDSVSAGVSVPFEFLAVSEGKGHLRILAVDEFTYYGAGAPKVTNAAVVVRDSLTQAIVTNGVTGVGGEVLFADLREAHYDVEVSADRHSTFGGTILVRGGRTNDFETFLSRQTVQYRWSVTPTTVEDRTRITLETTFETFVPAPVITITPGVIDLAGFTGMSTQINLVISNHGLVAAQEFAFELPTHPNFAFEALVTELGPVPAMSSLTVPVLIRRTGGGSVAGLRAAAASSSGPCGVSIGGCWQLPCGGRKNKYCAGVTVMNVGNCGGNSGSSGSGTTGGGGGGQPWMNFPSGGGGGPTYYALGTPQPFKPPFSFEPPKICDCDPDSFDEKCLKVPLSSSVLNAALSALQGAIAAAPNVSEIKIKAEGEVQLCICCSKPEGMGLSLSGGGGIQLKGKMAFPLAGGKLPAKEFQALGYDISVELLLGCAFEPSFDVNGSVSGKTKCHMKDLEAKGSLSVDLPMSVPCGATAEIVLRQNGNVISNISIGVSISAEYGLSGSVEYTLNSQGSQLTGTLCGKGLKIKGAIPVKFPGLIDKEFSYEHTVVEEDCLNFNSGPGVLVAKRIAAEAVAGQTAGESRMKKMALASLVKAALPPNPAPATSAGVCARVKLRLDQDLVMARNAFKAMLELDNGSSAGSISNLSVTLSIEDESGRTANEMFGIRPPVLSGLSGVDGIGSLGPNASGSATWILIPTSEAAPFGPTRYGVGGVLTYWQDGAAVSIPLFHAPITVYPDPRLIVQYFHQRDVLADDPFTREVVEPSVPFHLAVMVRNQGRGTADKVRIISSQPRIVENEKGLLVDFQIIGSVVEGGSQSAALTAEFGTIPPGTNRIAQWLMTSTLQGLFTDYQATFQHLDSLGKTNLSLIESVSIHEMIHLVQAGGAFEDGRPDFLVNDIPDGDDLPDTLYFSSGSTSSVAVVQTAAIDASPSEEDLAVVLTAAMPQGWAYLRVDDPSGGRLRLARVERLDGSVVALGTNAWTTDRHFIGNGQRPERRDEFHLLDHDSPGVYVLYYAANPPPDTGAPASAVAALPADSYSLFTVQWSGQDEAAGSGVGAYDVLVSEDDGPFRIWLQHTPLTSARFLGELGRRYAFYSVAIDSQGNREPAPLAPDTRTVASRVNQPPLVNVAPSITIAEGQTLALTPVVSDPDPEQTVRLHLAGGIPAGLTFDEATGAIAWPTGEGNGPSTNQIILVATDNGEPALSSTAIVSVVVTEVNTAPALAPIAKQKLGELQTLTLMAGASDNDLPAQILYFHLGASAPAGMIITPYTGILTWTPNETQGPATNQIQVIVTDSGSPQLSATQTFAVVVRDSRPSFVVAVGSTNVLAGNSGHVPVMVDSGLDLTNITLLLRLAPVTLQNLALAPQQSFVGSASLSPLGDGQYTLRLAASAGEVLAGAGEFARLSFGTSTNLPSSVAHLQALNVLGARVSGEVLAGVGAPGRVLVVNQEPLLVALSGEPRSLTLYGRDARLYELQYRTNLLGGAPWESFGVFTLTNNIRRITIGGNQGAMFFRAAETNAP